MVVVGCCWLLVVVGGGWLVVGRGWLVVVGWLVGWLVGWSVGWLVGLFVGWLVGWLVFGCSLGAYVRTQDVSSLLGKHPSASH